MSSEKNLVVFDRGAIAYIGEMVAEDCTADVLVLQRVVLGVAKKDGNFEIVSAPYASRDSKLTIRLSAMPGILITEPDHEIRKIYQDGIIKAYSSLVL